MTAEAAQQLANMYLLTTLGHAYQAANGIASSNKWHFLIRYQGAMPGEAFTVGKIIVNTDTASVIPLTAEQQCQLRERVLLHPIHQQQQLPRDEQGRVLRTDANDRATQWLSDQVGLHFRAVDGQLVKSTLPYWQFAIHFRLPHTGEIKAPGFIRVDGATGQVEPLTSQQIQTVQEYTRAILRDRALAPAA